MTNEQLTELSAKAIGLRLLDVTTDNGSRMIHPDDGGGFWNPLQSNDDVVRIVMLLELNVDAEMWDVYSRKMDCMTRIAWQPHQGHAAATSALRLAVTTLAARAELSKGETHE